MNALKHQKLKVILLGLVMSGLSLGLVTAQSSEQNEIAEEGSVKQRNIKFVPLPIIYSSPETSWAFGALGQLLFKFNPEDTVSRTSTFQLNLIYTLNNQYLINPIYNLIFNEEQYIASGNMSFRQFPEFYYGIGNGTSTDKEENFSYFSFDWDGWAVRKINNGIYVGITHKFMEMYEVQPDEGTVLETSTLPGARGFRIVGVGPMFLLDKRNSLINSTRGSYLEVSTRFFGGFLGSRFDYSLLRIDARKYVPLSKDERHVLAFQALGEFREGDIPVHRLSRMGGDSMMRGHYIGRYRDNHYWATQSEYRFPVYKRIGAIAFAGLGNVCDNCFEDNVFNDIKYSLGGGLRYMVNKAERVNIRLDYAFIRGGSEFYIQFTEAF